MSRPPRSQSFRHVKEGQTVTRLVGDEATQLLVTKVDRGLIYCGTLAFEQNRGLEVDPILGPEMWGAIRSQLRPEPRTTFRRPVHLPAPGKHVLQVILLIAYATTLVGMAVATGLGRFMLAFELGIAVAVLVLTMRVVAQDGRISGLRAGDKVWTARVSKK